MTGRVISSWNWRIYRAADHLRSRLYHAPVWSIRLQPVQQCLEVRGGDGVGVTAIADVVEHQLHPATTMLLGCRYISFDGGDGRPLLGIGWSPCCIRVSGWDGLSKDLVIVHTGDATSTVPRSRSRRQTGLATATMTGESSPQ